MKLIDKDAVLTIIEKLIDEIYAGRPFDSLSSEQQTALWYVKSIMSSIIPLKVIDVQEEPVSEKKCMFTKDSYTDEDRKVLCDGCEEDCEYAQREEPVSDECIYNRTLEERQKSCKFCSAACQVRIKEEPVSEDLEEEIDNYVKRNGYDGLDSIEEVKYIANHFAKWQKQQDQKTIELAEDHAMLAGMEKMKEQMMAKAVDGDITFDYYGDDDKTYGCVAHDSFCLEDFGLKDRDKVKLILAKED